MASPRSDPDGASAALAWRWIFAVAVLAVVVQLPVLGVGYVWDDYLQLAMLDGRYPADNGVFELYRLFDGDAEERQALRSIGIIPWWAEPSWHGSTFRPLASVLLAFDHMVAPRSATFGHAHSLAWLAATVVAAGAVFRPLVSPRIAVMALLVFALDESTSRPLAWLANRGALVAATFCFAALAIHILRRRGDTRRMLRWAERGCVVMAIGAGEYAFAGFAFVAAYELVQTDAWRIRARALAPYVIAGTAYLMIRAALGYGVTGTSVYADPLADPLGFLGWAINRIPRMLGDLLWGLPVGLDEFDLRFRFGWLPGLTNGSPRADVLPVVARLAAAATVVFGGVVWFASRRWTTAQRFAARWATLGTLLALVPMSAAVAHARLLVVPSLGASIVIALIIGSAWPARGTLRGGTHVAVAVALAAIHLVVSPIVRQVDNRRFADVHHRYARDYAGPRVADLDLGGRRVVVVAAMEPVTGLYGPQVLGSLHRPVPSSWQLLSMTRKPHQLTRVSTNVVELSAMGNPMLTSLLAGFYREDMSALVPGTEIEHGGLRITVIEPGPARLRIEVLGGAGEVVFLQTDRFGFRRLDLPPVGASVILRSPALPPRGGAAEAATPP